MPVAVLQAAVGYPELQSHAPWDSSLHRVNLGFPSASEKRATTCNGCPENKGEREYAAAFGMPTNLPNAQGLWCNLKVRPESVRSVVRF
jgi:hypothetical protein